MSMILASEEVGEYARRLKIALDAVDDDTGIPDLLLKGMRIDYGHLEALASNR